MIELRKVAKWLAGLIASESKEDFEVLLEQVLAELKKLRHEAKLALSEAYVFSRKAPREEREDLFQDLFLALWEAKVKDEKLAYAIARCDWKDWWKRYKVRQHYSLDFEVEGEDGESYRFGEMLVAEVGWENKVDGDLDGEALWKKLPSDIKRIVSKRLAGRALTGSERMKLSRFARKHAELLIS